MEKYFIVLSEQNLSPLWRNRNMHKKKIVRVVLKLLIYSKYLIFI